VRTDEESGQTIISGMGELHLEIIVDRMKREFGVEANVGKPQVAYREAIKKKVESEGKFIKQSGGKGQYGHVLLKLEPNYREVLVLRFHEELSLEEIASVTRAPLSTVKSRLYRGLAALKPEMERVRNAPNPAEATR